MSLWSRIANVFQQNRVSREIEEEIQSHIAEAIAEGRDPGQARRAFGSVLHHRERSCDIRLLLWLESLRADAVFGWRQITKRKVTSAAAILSLALAIGACTSAFRLIDALLLRALPVADPERLHVIAFEGSGPDGKNMIYDASSYPMFRQMRATVKDQAELIAMSYAERIDLTYGASQEVEKAYRQLVSGWTFGSFGLRPAAGRLLSANDDLTPGAHPVAVLSYDYWTRRFGRDPKAVGRTFRMDGDLYQIVGVAQEPFTGAEPGTVTDIFVPTMMVKHGGIVRSDYQWFRTFLKLKPGVSVPAVREKLRAVFRATQEERVRALPGTPKREMDAYLGQRLLLNPASAGVSGMQREYGSALSVLGGIVALVLLIACANVANLMTAQATARQREMALRVSIGAGQGRLVQLVIVEFAWLALLAAGIGACFTWWSAPFVVGMIGTPGNPVRLVLPGDWRVVGFGLAMALGVTILFGLGPSLRVSGVKPVSALKGGDNPHTRPRMMQALIAIQVTFCMVVLFIAGLLIRTSGRLSHQNTGFSAERLLTIETLSAQPQPPPAWEQVAEHLRAASGVEAVALCEWPLMAGGSWNGFISVNGAPPSPVASYFLSVSPGWRELMKIPLLQGRDFRGSDTLPGYALVNETFARQYFRTEGPVGRLFEVVSNEGRRVPYEILGVVGDARYRNMRESMQPTAFFPFKANYSRATFMVRTASPNPLAMGSVLRQEVARARAGFHVSNILTQNALVEQHTVRERLLGILALFFGIVAVLLAGVGLYGVLDYSVLRRRREIGIRVAIGAQAGDIARRVTIDVIAMVLTGLLAGIMLGIASVRYIDSLLFEVKATDLGAIALPAVTILAVALVAALPAVIRAIRIDPVIMLRSE
jgi:putative ABC transport system permease protein